MIWLYFVLILLRRWGDESADLGNSERESLERKTPHVWVGINDELVRGSLTGLGRTRLVHVDMSHDGCCLCCSYGPAVC